MIMVGQQTRSLTGTGAKTLWQKCICVSCCASGSIYSRSSRFHGRIAGWVSPDSLSDPISGVAGAILRAAGSFLFCFVLFLLLLDGSVSLCGWFFSFAFVSPLRNWSASCNQFFLYCVKDVYSVCLQCVYIWILDLFHSGHLL
jgi:hypothetical protein